EPSTQSWCSVATRGAARRRRRLATGVAGAASAFFLPLATLAAATLACADLWLAAGATAAGRRNSALVKAAVNSSLSSWAGARQ
nr:hypothetical protein [Tanacetum cinerariifolium]